MRTADAGPHPVGLGGPGGGVGQGPCRLPGRTLPVDAWSGSDAVGQPSTQPYPRAMSTTLARIR